MFEKLQKVLLWILLIVVAISYLDIFNSYDDLYVASSLSKYILALTAVCFLISFNINCLRNRYIKTSVLFIIIIAINAIAIHLIFDTNVYFMELKNVAIPLIALFIGYNIRFSPKYMTTIYITYGVTLLAVGISLIINNIGALVITDLYKVASKNALGVMMASYVAIALPLLLSQKHRPAIKLLYLVLCIAFFIVLLTIRARASTITVFFTVAIFIIEILVKGKNDYPGLSRKIITAGIIILLLMPILSATVYPVNEYIHNSLFLNVEDDVTTGRLTRNKAALDFLLGGNLFLGRLENAANFEWVHNYFLRVLAEYGLVFGLILVIFYFYLLIKTLKFFLHKDVLQLNSIGLWALLPPLMLSFIEPLFPYGPGTSVLLTYILLGWSIKEASK